MHKSFSRFSAFALSLAVVVMVTVGVFAYDDHLAQTLEGYGDPVPLDLAPATLTVGATDFRATYSNFASPFTSFNTTITSLTNTSTYDSLGAMVNSRSVSVSGSVTYVDLNFPTTVSVGAGSELHVAGSFNFSIGLLTQFYHSYQDQSTTGNPYYLYYSYTPASNYILYANAVSLVLDGVVVDTIPLSGTSNAVAFDFVVPVTSGASSVVLRLSFPGSFSGSRVYTRTSSGSNSRYSARLFYTTSSTTAVGYRYLGNQNVSYEVNTLPVDYTDILYQILTAVKSLVAQGGELSPMEQFENDYLDNFSGQISQAEQAISPSNPALPNGGDVGGFVSDLGSGLGLSGSSFSASDLNEAASGFSGAEATAPGGPWEFFTQGVADSLSGDAPMSIDDDYDPILAWLEDSERRWGTWSNP